MVEQHGGYNWQMALQVQSSTSWQQALTGWVIPADTPSLRCQTPTSAWMPKTCPKQLPYVLCYEVAAGDTGKMTMHENTLENSQDKDLRTTLRTIFNFENSGAAPKDGQDTFFFSLQAKAGLNFDCFFYCFTKPMTASAKLIVYVARIPYMNTSASLAQENAEAYCKPMPAADHSNKHCTCATNHQSSLQCLLLVGSLQQLSCIGLDIHLPSFRPINHFHDFLTPSQFNGTVRQESEYTKHFLHKNTKRYRTWNY